ncbi:hypothetical protein F2Q69_00007382 [Brassica cretica]|uniref:SWIM-type domain-containing protein n=1 Tax=Brassica cretica TaxID=69181 RepID=A0A8S9PNU1_BRACR|nr:hypothetical protein F2Q69_00007382 [Brassica cretica]
MKSSFYPELFAKKTSGRLTWKSSKILFRDSGQTLLILDDFHVSRLAYDFRVSRLAYDFRVSRLADDFRVSHLADDFRVSRLADDFRVSRLADDFRVSRLAESSGGRLRCSGGSSIRSRQRIERGSEVPQRRHEVAPAGSDVIRATGPSRSHFRCPELESCSRSDVSQRPREFIRDKLSRWFWKRREDALSLTTQHSRGVEYLLVVRSEISDTMYVQQIDGWRFFVQGGRMDCVVDLAHRKCDCGVYGVEKIPCCHAIAAGSYAGLHISTLVCPVYSKDILFVGYSENIYPCAGQQVEAHTSFSLEVKRGPGRHKKSRWKSWLKLSRMRGRTTQKQHMVYRCSVCKETGHTRQHCKN